MIAPAVVHIVDPSACGDEGVLSCAISINRISRCRHHVVLVGNADDERRALQLGIRTLDRVPLCASVRLTAARVRAVIDARIARAELGRTLVQCWSAHALMLAQRATGHLSRVGILARAPIHDDERRALSGAVLCAFDTRVRESLALASAEDRDIHAARARVRVIEPPIVDLDELAAFGEPDGLTDRVRLREALGIAPEQRVVGLLADPPSAGDARRVCFAIGLDHVLGVSTIALVRRGALQTRRAARFNRLNARRWDLIAADLSLLQLIAASDVCVVDTDSETDGSPSCGPTGVALAHTLGVPVAGSRNGSPSLPGTTPLPVLLPGGLRTGAGELAVPIERLLRDEPTRIEHAHAARAWLDAARAHSGFANVLANIWSEVWRMPISSDRAAASVSYA